MTASDSTGDSGECSYSTNSRPSLLDRLKCQEPSVYARKRKVKTNPPVGAKKSQQHSALSHMYTRNLSRQHNEIALICLRIIGNILGNNFSSRRKFFGNRRME